MRKNGDRLLAKLILISILAFPLAMPSVAAAAVKVYPGSNCVFVSKGTNWRLSRGGLENDNSVFSSRARVNCPIIKEHPGATITFAGVRVINGYVPATLSCELVAVEVVPGRATAQRTGPSWSMFKTAQSVEFGDLRPFNPSGFGNVWFIDCNMPSDARILGYVVDQQ